MMEFRDSNNSMALHIVDNKCYDIYGRWVYVKNGDYIQDASGNWLFAIHGDKVYDNRGNWVYNVHQSPQAQQPVHESNPHDIVTCAYCGRRASLSKDRSCEGCGAVISANEPGIAPVAAPVPQKPSYEKTPALPVPQHISHNRVILRNPWRTQTIIVVAFFSIVIALIALTYAIDNIGTGTGTGVESAVTPAAGQIIGGSQTSSIPPVIDESLVGTWDRSTDMNWFYTFASDGTGTRRGSSGTFTWSAEDGVLRIRSYPVIFSTRDEVWEYVIEGNTLMRNRRGSGIIRYYIQQGADPIPPIEHDLIGVWANVENRNDLLVFEAYGIGTMGSNTMQWWIIGDDRVAADVTGSDNIVYIDYYEINDGYLTIRKTRRRPTAVDGQLRTTLRTREYTFAWRAEDLESFEVPIRMLIDEGMRNRLITYASALEFAEIINMVDQYLYTADATEDDIAHEVRELAVRAQEILEHTYTFVDHFDGRITVYYPGVREISSSIHVVPHIRPGPANVTFYLTMGFERERWLSFDSTSLRMADGSFFTRGYNFFDTNTEIIHGGIREAITINSRSDLNPSSHRQPTPRISRAEMLNLEQQMTGYYAPMLRFANRGDDTNHDVTLSALEIRAITTIAELYNIMYRLRSELPREFRSR